MGVDVFQRLGPISGCARNCQSQRVDVFQRHGPVSDRVCRRQPRKSERLGPYSGKARTIQKSADVFQRIGPGSSRDSDSQPRELVGVDYGWIPIASPCFSSVGQLDGHQKAVTGIAFPAGSDKLYTGSKDGNVRVWDCKSGELSGDVIKTHMKQGYQESSSSRSYRPPRYNSDAQKVADHYSSRTNQTREERNSSPIIQLKKLNNWIKSALIQLYTKPGDSVLDLACGKGGDLIKWNHARVGYYVGVDIADGSIEHCRERYNEMRRSSFPATLICADCFEAELDQVLAGSNPFDVCSSQFAWHYSWSTKARARCALANVSALLRPGGVFIGTMPDANVIIKRLRKTRGLRFGNGIYSIEFREECSEEKLKSSAPFGIEYLFNLKGAIDNYPEWLVPFPVFKALAEEYGLELVFAKNSGDFVDEYMQKLEFIELMRKINNSDKTPSPQEWEVVYLYMAFALRKRGLPDQKRPSVRHDEGKMHLRPSDIMFIWCRRSNVVDRFTMDVSF